MDPDPATIALRLIGAAIVAGLVVVTLLALA